MQIPPRSRRGRGASPTSSESRSSEAGSGASDISSTRRERFPRKWLAALLVVAFVLRLAVVVSPRADLFGSAEVCPNVRIGEEIARGNAAVDFLAGPVLPVVDYQYAHFFGGSLVLALLAAPLFALFGPRLWVLKFVPVLFHLFGVWLVVRILDRHVSRRAAWIGGLLYACTPPGYTVLSTVAWGSHLESNTLALAALALWLELPRGDRRLWPRLRLGLFGGFCAYFGYQCLLFLVVLGAADLFRRPRPRPGQWAVQAAGFAIGFSPWLVYNLRHDYRGLVVYGRDLGEHLAASGFLERLQQLVTHGFPGAIGFESEALNLVIFGLFTLACAGAALRRSTVGWIALGYLLVFSGAYLVSDFRIGKSPGVFASYRYAYLVGPWVVLATAVAVEGLVARGGRLGGAALGTVALLGLVSGGGSMVVACDAQRFGDDYEELGADAASHARWLVMRMLERPQDVPLLVSNLGERRTWEEAKATYRSIGKFLGGMGRIRPSYAPERMEEALRMQALCASFRDHVPAGARRYFHVPRTELAENQVPPLGR